MQRDYDTGKIPSDLIPESEFNFIITAVTDTKNGEVWKTKNGDDYVQIECQVDDQCEWTGRKLWHGVTIMDEGKKGVFFLISFLGSIGEPNDGKFIINTDNWIGKRFKAKVKQGKDLKGREKNEIAYFISQKQADDEVPF